MNISFIEFLARSGAIKFGDFTLRSGRQSPYFISTGVLASGGLTYELGKYYASVIKEAFGENFDVVYGPAYKGISLAISTCIALQKEYGMNKQWVFDRKEKKVHGDGSAFIGAAIDRDARLVLVDDVMTTGGTKFEAIEKIESGLGARVVGLVIAVDRQEMGRKRSAVVEFSEEANIPVHSITNIADVFNHLKGRNIEGKVYINDAVFRSYEEYRQKYGMWQLV